MNHKTQFLEQSYLDFQHHKWMGSFFNEIEWNIPELVASLDWVVVTRAVFAAVVLLY